MRVEGKVAIVTGSTRGVGAATALRLAEKGAKVVITGRAADLGEFVAAKIRERGGAALFVGADLKSEAQVRRLVEAAADHFGALHVLVNNAAPTEMLFNGQEKSVFEQTTEDYDDILKVGQYAVFWATKYAIPHMVRAGGGSIINISSIAGSQGGAAMHAYSVTKGAIDAFTRQVAADTAALGIRCNTVMLGAINNGGFARQLAEHPAYAEANRSLNMLGRWGLPGEVANLVTFLASDEASFITAAHIPCDGGQLNRLAVPRFTDITLAEQADG